VTINGLAQGRQRHGECPLRLRSRLAIGSAASAGHTAARQCSCGFLRPAASPSPERHDDAACLVEARYLIRYRLDTLRRPIADVTSCPRLIDAGTEDEAHSDRPLDGSAATETKVVPV
jgi:hypothetical protein